MSGVRDLVFFLAQAVLPDCKFIDVTEREDNDQLVFDISVPEDEVGRLIGRHGRIIQSIRSVAKAVAKRKGIHINIEVIGRIDQPEVSG